MSDQDVEPDGHDHQDHAAHHQAHLVAGRLRLPERDQEGHAEREDDEELPARRHTLTTSRRPKMPCGKSSRARIIRREADGVARAGADIGLDEFFDHAVADADDDHAARIGDAGDDGDAEGLQPDQRTHGRRGLHDRRDQNAGERADRRRERVGDHRDPERIDAHQSRGGRIERHRAHGAAERGAAIEQLRARSSPAMATIGSSNSCG